MAPGIFKGLKVILNRDLGRECPISLPLDRMDCCIPRTFYSQPDFRVVTSLFEEHRGKRNFEVLFLPRVPSRA